MPKLSVDECSAGPAMDAAVARALGLKVKWEQWVNEGRPVYLAGTYSNEYDGWTEHENWRPVLPYSTDIGAAWELIEWCRMNLNLLSTLIEWKECWDTTLSDGSNSYGAIAETVPLAICRAFLKANGVEFVEVLE